MDPWIIHSITRESALALFYLSENLFRPQVNHGRLLRELGVIAGHDIRLSDRVVLLVIFREHPIPEEKSTSSEKEANVYFLAAASLFSSVSA